MSKVQRLSSAVALLFVFFCLGSASALAQTPPVPVRQLIGTGATLVAGDVTFSNFAQVIPGTGTGFVITIPFQPVAVDTPVTLSATYNGVTLNSTVTIPKMVDVVKVSKAELVVKNLSLKVDATSTVPSAVLTLYNASIGQLIGTMTNNGLSSTGAKYSFQGTVSPVTSLLLKSSFNGTATGAVAQK